MPNYYNPYYPQGYYQPQQQQMQTPAPTAPQIQNGGFVSVRNEAEARNYPVAPGNSITFKDETAPYVYTKTMGFSQLDRPVFDKYRLVKEETPVETHETRQNDVLELDPINTTIDALKAEIEAIWSEIETIKKKPTPKSTTSKKKEVEEDEQ